MFDMAQKNNLNQSTTAFFLCDMQERFKPAIDNFAGITEVAKRLVDASKILDIPLVVTEQYPKGLGKTLDELDTSNAALKLEKTKFTMFCNQVKELLDQKSIKTVVLFGVETHVCILQTAIDLLTNGFNVHVVADGCSSRSPTDRLFALDRLRQAGAIIVTHESVLFQMIADKNHDKFKEIQGLMKNKGPDTGLLYRHSTI